MRRAIEFNKRGCAASTRQALVSTRRASSRNALTFSVALLHEHKAHSHMDPSALRSLVPTTIH
jgi:hypothetical protein